MEITSFCLGVLQTNCYVIMGEQDAAVVDPGGDPEELVSFIKKSKRTLTKIVLSHGHADHVAGAAALQRATGASIHMHPEDTTLLTATSDPMAAYLGLTEEIPLDYHLTPGHTISLGNTLFEMLHTPGHTQGSCCLYSKEQQVLISGDTLFAGSIGRSDLYGGDPQQLAQSLSKLKELPAETKVYPGHGPSTTIGEERVRNRFW